MFKPGCTIKLSRTNASYAERELDINLRHNVIQSALYEHLCSLYGVAHVGTEGANADGRVDVIVDRSGTYWFYEIKTASTARGCISEALAQLLEYSYWPGAQKAERLIVVGEPALDSHSEQYLVTLQSELNLPIEYAQFDLTESRIIPNVHGAVK